MRFEEMRTEIEALKQELERQRTSGMAHHPDPANGADQNVLTNLQTDMDK